MDFCTYFDSAYAIKGKVCHHTLMAQGPAKLFVLCLDTNVELMVSSWQNVIPIKLTEIEKYRPQLLAIKFQRQPKEYFATITPILPQYIFDNFGMEKLFYTDADMGFFSSITEIENVMGNYSLLVTPHENPIAHVAGRFNVGIIGFRNDNNCKEFLKWWEERCLEWCEWRATSDGKCADQGYLTIFYNQPNKFENILICPQPGINLGAWDLARHKTEIKNNKVVLDNNYNLVCYHFHGYKCLDDKCVNDTGWEVSSWNMEHIYHPYHELVLRAKTNIL